jgi:hypothetical protein
MEKWGNSDSVASESMWLFDSPKRAKEMKKQRSTKSYRVFSWTSVLLNWSQSDFSEEMFFQKSPVYSTGFSI